MRRLTKHKKQVALAKLQQKSSDAAMKALVAQQKATQQNHTLFSPGQPMPTQPGVTPGGVPRQYDYPLLVNTSGIDRTRYTPGVDTPTFDQLRMLGRMYSGITIPKRVWLDLIPGLKLKIGLTPEMKAQGYDDKDFQEEITGYLKKFEKPDGRQDYHSWLRQAVKDQLDIDDVYAYKRRTRGGKFYGLEIVDGSTIKPLLDPWGRHPLPPLYAYQQFTEGMPGEKFTLDDFLHYQESPCSDSPFGFSRIESFLQEVNIGLRKNDRDLKIFTEGNLGAGFMEVPEGAGWKPDDILKFERLYNSLNAGNAQQQVRIKFMQPGMKFTRTDPIEILTEINQTLFRIACGAFGISLADIAFTEDIHKSADKGQQSMLYRRTLGPVVVMYAKVFFTDVIHYEFNDPRFEASFSGYEEEDDVSQLATAYEKFTGMGALAPSDVAHIMNFPDVPKTGPFIIGPGGQPIFLKDLEEGSPLRKKQQEATMKGLDMAMQEPEEQEDDEQEQEETGQEDDQAGDERPEKERAALSLHGSKNNAISEHDRQARAEYRRWRQCAIDDLKRGRAVRDFASNILSRSEMRTVAQALLAVSTPDEVRAVFKAVQEGTLERAEMGIGEGIEWTDKDLDELAIVDDDTLAEAALLWKRQAPEELAGLLNAGEAND